MKNMVFDIEKQIILKKEEEIDFVPKLLKRRLSKLDKSVLFAFQSCYDNNIEKIVFSSRYGEFERLLKIINQYTAENEVSPMIFSASVHNYPVSFFSLFKNKKIPTTSISGLDKSFSQGLLSALCSKENKILYCYSEEENQNIFSVCLYLNKNPNGRYILKIKDKSDNTKDSAAEIEKFLNEKSAEFSIFTIESAEHD